METEQAHSVGRVTFGAPWGPRTYLPPGRVSKVGFARLAPVTWLNLVCLDAPLVSVAWLWLFARTFHATINPIHAVALFLTAWLIYLADRLMDSYSLRAGRPRSLRHEFCSNHRPVWIGALIVIATIDAFLIWRSVGGETFRAGAVIGSLAFLYLLLNHSLGRIWQQLAVKEVTIGLLFAAGTAVALRPDLSITSESFWLAAVGFASLCVLNCVSIASWERELDLAQGKVSVATEYPGIRRYLIGISLGLGLLFFAASLAGRETLPIYACATVSALLLAALDYCRDNLDRDCRTALADIVLLTPFLAGLVGLW